MEKKKKRDLESIDKTVNRLVQCGDIEKENINNASVLEYILSKDFNGKGSILNLVYNKNLDGDKYHIAIIKDPFAFYGLDNEGNELPEILNYNKAAHFEFSFKNLNNKNIEIIKDLIEQYILVNS